MTELAGKAPEQPSRRRPMLSPSLRLEACWEVWNRPVRQCALCGARLTPYLPRCGICQAQVVPGVREMAPSEWSRIKAPECVRVAHLSDLHVGQPNAERLPPITLFRMWLEHLESLDVDLLVVSGDLVERPGDRPGLERVRAFMDDCTMDWMVVPGNHDIRRPGWHDVFYEVYGKFPRVEVHKGVGFLLFDSMVGLPLEQRDMAERMYGDYVCYTEGRIGGGQFSQMELEVEAKLEAVAQRVVVLHHHVMRQHADVMPRTPKRIGLTEDVFGTMKALQDAEQLFAWCAARGVNTIMHGHKHLFQQPGMRAKDVLVLNAGSSTLRLGTQRGRVMDMWPQKRVIANLELCV